MRGRGKPHLEGVVWAKTEDGEGRTQWWRWEDRALRRPKAEDAGHSAGRSVGWLPETERKILKTAPELNQYVSDTGQPRRSRNLEEKQELYVQ